MERPRVRLIAWIGAIYLLGYASWLIFGWGGPNVVTVVSDLGSLVAEALAVFCVVLAIASTSGRQRIAWVALAAALASWFAGDAIWAIYELGLGAEVPFPSLADLGYLAFYACTLFVLVVLPTGNAGVTVARLFLDGLLLAVSFFALAWVSGLDDVVAAGGTDPLSFALSLFYPLADVALFTMAALMLSRAGPDQRVTISVTVARLFLDGLLLAVSFFALAWVSGLDDVVAAGGTDPLSFALSLFYPLADVALFTMAALMLSRAGPDQRVTISLLATGIAVVAIADSVYVYLSIDGTYLSGNYIDILWTGGVMLMAVAALVAARARWHVVDSHDSTQAAVWVPYVPLLVAVIPSVWYLFGGKTPARYKRRCCC